MGTLVTTINSGKRGCRLQGRWCRCAPEVLPLGNSELCHPQILVDWVTEHWQTGSLMEAMDRRLQSDYNTDEVCLVLKLGLWCSHPLPNARPIMQQVMLYLEGGISVPEFVPMDVACIPGFDSHDILSHEHWHSVWTLRRKMRLLWMLLWVYIFSVRLSGFIM